MNDKHGVDDKLVVAKDDHDHDDDTDNTEDLTQACEAAARALSAEDGEQDYWQALFPALPDVPMKLHNQAQTCTATMITTVFEGMLHSEDPVVKVIPDGNEEMDSFIELNMTFIEKSTTTTAPTTMAACTKRRSRFSFRQQQ
jgi:hypothetical protein